MEKLDNEVSIIFLSTFFSLWLFSFALPETTETIVLFFIENNVARIIFLIFAVVLLFFVSILGDAYDVFSLYGFLAGMGVFSYYLWMWTYKGDTIGLVGISAFIIGSASLFFFAREYLFQDYFSKLSYKRQWRNLLKEKKKNVVRKNKMEDSKTFVSPMNNSVEGRSLHNELIKFQSSIPGLPKLPTHSIAYEGWFNEVKKGIAIRKEQQSIYEYTETLRRYNELHDEYLELMKKYVEAQETKNNMILANEKEKMISIQMDVEKTELLARKKRSEVDIAKSEAKIKELQNPKQSPRTSIREQKEEELYLAQIQAQIDRIKNPPAKPSIADPLIRRAEKITELKKNMDIEEEKARKNGLNEKMIGDIKRMFTLEIGNIMEGK